MSSTTLSYLIEQLSELDSTLDVRTGTAARDLLLGPLSTIMTDYKDSLEDFISNWSATDADSISEDVMDRVASFYMLERNEGSNATVSVRLYFSQPTTFNVRTSDAFSTGDGLNFYPQESIGISADALTYDSSTNYVYYDITCEAQAVGVEYIIAAETIVAGPDINNLAYVTNISAASGGVDRETNADLLARIQSAISYDSLETPAGIESALASNFPTLSASYVAGMGDDLMTRDIEALPVRLAELAGWRAGTISSSTKLSDSTFFTDTGLSDVSALAYAGKVLVKIGTTTQMYDTVSTTKNGNGLDIIVSGTLETGTCQYKIYGHSYYRTHRGGKIDVWLSGTDVSDYFIILDSAASNLISSSNTSLVDADSATADLNFPMSITRVVAMDPLTLTELESGELVYGADYSVTCSNNDYRGSVEEDGLVSVNIISDTWVGLPIKVEYEYDTSVQNVQTYFDGASIKAPAVSVLAKKMKVVYVDAYVDVPSNAWGAQTIDSDTIEDYLEDYFNGETGAFGISGSFSYWDMRTGLTAEAGSDVTSLSLEFVEVGHDGDEVTYETPSGGAPVAVSIGENCIYEVRSVVIS